MCHMHQNHRTSSALCASIAAWNAPNVLNLGLSHEPGTLDVLTHRVSNIVLQSMELGMDKAEAKSKMFRNTCGKTERLQVTL